jgi:hypothetical protein
MLQTLACLLVTNDRALALYKCSSTRFNSMYSDSFFTVCIVSASQSAFLPVIVPLQTQLNSEHVLRTHLPGNFRVCSLHHWFMFATSTLLNLAGETAAEFMKLIRQSDERYLL